MRSNIDLRRNSKRLAVVIAVIVIPLMYSFFYLNAFWDPYSKLESLPVAVVNEDKGAVVNSQNRNLGNELVSELKSNKELKWMFTTKAEATEGLKNRKYYAMVDITENFSVNIASADSTSKKQAVLVYQPQQKRNFLAAQIINRAMTALEMKISEKAAKEMVNYLADETKKLPDQLGKLGEGLDKLHTDGTSKLKDNMGMLVDNQQKFNSGLSQVNGYLIQTNKALSNVIPQFRQLSEGSLLFQKNLTTLNAGLIGINQGASKMKVSIPQLKTGLNTYSEGLKTFSQNITPLATGLEPLKNGSSKLYAGMSDYTSKMSTFDTGVTQYVSSVKSLSDTNKSVASMLTAYVAQHPEALKDTNIQNMIAIMQKSKGSLSQLDAASDSIKSNVDALSAASQQLTAGSKQVNDGINKFADGALPLSKGAEQLVSGALPITNGLDQISSGTEQMLAVLDQVATGSTKLKEGYTAINDGIQKTSSMSQLQEGVAKIAAGGMTLQDSSAKLLEGEKKIYEGTAELDSKVAAAGKEVSDSVKGANDKVAKLDGLADFVADPVKIDEQDVDPVHDYGTAFAPYFVSLSLWVGALIMFIVIYLNPEIRFRRKLLKKAHLDIKFIIYPLIGVAQSIALGFILLSILKLNVVNEPLFFAVIILTSLCFISIVQFLIVNLKDIGKFLAMVLLILQLTASGGTFPNELVPKFFNIINPFMPMTYSIYSLKETISGCNYGFLYQNMLVLAGITVVFLVASLILSANKHSKSIDEIESELIHEREQLSADLSN